jgi:RNA polymerase sigma-70 factor (ECF subfamily)
MDRRATMPAETLFTHEKGLRRLARGLVRGEADVDDVLQETWLAALKQQGVAVRHERAWLAGVLRNVVRTRQRAEARRRVRETRAAKGDARPAVDDAASLLEQRRRLLRLVEDLPAGQREVLTLRYFAGIPPRRIARRLHLPVPTVKTRLRRALVRMRERLDADADGDRRRWMAALAPLAWAAPALRWIAVAGVAAVAALVLLSGGWLGASRHRRSSDGSGGGSPLLARDGNEHASPRLRGRSRKENLPPRPVPPPSPPAPAPTTGALRLPLHVRGDDAPPCVVDLLLADGSQRRVTLSQQEATDLDGLPPGRVDAVPRPADRYVGGEAAAVVRAGQASVLEIVWEPAGRVSGRVLDARTRMPIPGADVRALVGDDYPAYEGRTASPWHATSDPEGRFRLEGVPSSRDLVLVTTAAEHAAGDGLVRPDARGDVLVLLAPGGTIRGRVLLPDGSPARDALVFAVPPTNGEMRAWLPEPWADRLLRDPPGTTRVLFDCDPQNGEVDTVRPPWVLATRADGDGDYLLEGAVLEHRLLLQAYPSPRNAEGLLGSTAVPVAISTERRDARGDLRLLGRAKVVVTVHDATGRPCVGARVAFQDARTLPERTVDENGRVVCDLPAQPQDVRVHHPDWAPWKREIRLSPGETRALDVVLEEAEHLTVRVLTQDGRPSPVDGVFATVWQDGRPHHGVRGESGRYSFGGLGSGEARLTVRKAGPDGSDTATDVHIPSEEVVVRMGPPRGTSRGRIPIRMIFPEDAPMPATVAVGLWPFPTSVAGTFRELHGDDVWERAGGGLSNVAWFRFDVPDDVLEYRDSFGGTRTLGLRGPGWAIVQIPPRVLRDGTPTVRLEAARHVEGVVLDAQGRAVAGARLAFGPASYGVLLSGRTDSQGRFRADEVPRDVRDVAVVATGFVDQVRALPTAPGPVRIVLAAGGTVSLRVRNDAGEPLPGRTVRVVAAESETDDPQQVLYLGDRTGTAVGLPVGTWRFIDQESRETVTVSLQEGETADVVLAVP